VQRVKALGLKFVTDALYGDHLRGADHPERPDRVEAVAALLRAGGVLAESLDARDATREEIQQVHTLGYVELVARETAAANGVRELSTGDTLVDATSYRVAVRAAGGAIVAVEASLAGGEAVFALVRPPGHHAEPARGMGFCVFNNAAIAARAAGRRVLVVDFDYHHGNGTEAVAGDGLSYASTHAAPAYPGTGTRSYRLGRDAVVNVPLPAGGVSTEAFVALWQMLLPAVARSVAPELLVVSAGFDYIAGDPVGDLGIGVEAAAPIAAAIRSVAGEYCGGAVAYVLEGGYGVGALARSIAAIAAAHGGQAAPLGDADLRAIPEPVRARVQAFFNSR